MGVERGAGNPHLCILFLQNVKSEFGRVCERRKLRVNVGKSKVMRCSRHGDGDGPHVI